MRVKSPGFSKNTATPVAVEAPAKPHRSGLVRIAATARKARKPPQCAGGPRHRFALHVHGRAGKSGCVACDAALQKADTGVEAFHALCSVGKAFLLPMMAPATRDFARLADAAMASLDAEAAR